MFYTWFWNYRARLIFLALAVPIVLFCLGVGELWRCLRTLLPASSISYAEASQKGLGGYGYVRLTDIHPAVERGVIITLRKHDGYGGIGETTWDGVFVPVEPADEAATELGKYRLLIWMPQARSPEDVRSLAQGTESESGATELLCFVDAPFPQINPGYQGFVKHLAGARGENCWVVKVWKPSWMKGLGLTLASAVIPGLFVVWRIRKPLYEDN